MFDLVRQILTITPKEEVERFGNVAVLVDFLKSYGTYPPFLAVEEGVNEPECVIEGKRYLMFTANNYLSLSEHPQVKAAAMAAIDKYGVGPGGARVMSGTVDVTLELEEKLAALTGKEACLTFPTGYMANITVFQAVMGSFLGRMPYDRRESAIFVDELIHGSVEDGIKLSGVQSFRFQHNDLYELESKLSDTDATNKLIVTEGVYCLEGEVIDIPAYARVARRYGAKLMVDDAHAIGVLGPHGGGSPDYHDCAGEIDLLMGCMDKAMGGTGGYLCGSRAMIDFLKIAANTSMLSSALPCGMAAAMNEAVDMIKQGDHVRRGLEEKSRYLKDGLRHLGFSVMGTHDIPSVPLFIGEEDLGIEFAKRLRDRGIFVIIMRWPGVPAGRARFRLSLMHRHTTEHLDALLEACGAVGRELGMIL